jgi:broad specificity phosphatase PhoE
MKNRRMTWIGMALALLASWNVSAELTVYYLRHGQGGHNIDKEYVRKNVPENEWTNWMNLVGNSGVFTPKGEVQVQALVTNLRPFRFDFITVSPKWRARNTILPFLKAAGRTAEIWPELLETSFVGDSSDQAAKQVSSNLLAGVSDFQLPAEEQPFFQLRADGSGNRVLAPANPAEAGALARRVESLLHARFGTNDVNVLLVGHGTAGLTLIRRLTRNPAAGARYMDNTHLWRAQEKVDGTFELNYHDLSASKAAESEPTQP